MMKILFAASEAVPFMKTGGLADVTGSLPGYFDKKHFDVRIIMPKYLCMDEKWKAQLRFVCHFYVNLSWRRQYVGIFETVQNGITYYFVDNEFYFAGDKPYHNIYEDVEKFAFFSKAVLEALPYLDFWPDVIHCHDWQTGLVPVFLRTFYGDERCYSNIRTVFSIHNLKFQGRFSLPAVIDITGLPEQIFSSDKLESYGEANYLKGGVVYADAVTTVSPTYAREIMTPEGGEGLDGLMRAREGSLYGILNGIDIREYDPQTDAYLANHYNETNHTEGKGLNKLKLQKLLGLPVDKDVFLLGMVSRMTDQKGFDLIAYVMDELMSTERLQLVVAGTGEARYEEMLRYFAEKYPQKIHVTIGYSEELAHRIYGSCDAFLMPSLFEPCGLSQLMSLRYGTVPIVRETGGLKDDGDAVTMNTSRPAQDFSFANYNAHEMLGVPPLCDARVLPAEKMLERHCGSVRCGRIFSWKKSAETYARLYEDIVGRP